MQSDRFKTATILRLCLVFSLGACSTLLTWPDQLTQAERFKAFPSDTIPTQKPIDIYWDKHSIPFIEATSDKDLAFATGLVHAHLRIDQIEVLRILSQGRLSEVAGPISIISQIDTFLRMIDFMGSADMSYQRMSPQSREWMDEFTRGLNWYLSQSRDKAITNKVLDLKSKPYSVQEVIAISRLISSDLTWGSYIKFLSIEDPDKRAQAFEQSIHELKENVSSDRGTEVTKLQKLIQSFSKSGSNSIVIAKEKSNTGSALIANDPHVGLFLPNFWLLMGIKSPSYHAVGYMIPGVPIIGVGRNTSIAWGGTNMRGISSHLYDVTNLAEEDFDTQRIRLNRRWWFDKTVTIRRTKFGPVISDLPFLKKKNPNSDIAMDWVGREGSDEVGAFLGAMRAKNWKEFRKAFASYKVSAFNMVYADKLGNIGMIPAYGQPKLTRPEQTLTLIKSASNPRIGVISPLELPQIFNPKNHFIASANNKPFERTKIPFSFSYASSDRISRLQYLAKSQPILGVNDLKSLQLDTFVRSDFKLAQLLSEKLTLPDDDKTASLVMARLKQMKTWDGHYQSDSSAAVTFHMLKKVLWDAMLEADKNGDLDFRSSNTELVQDFAEKSSAQELLEIVMKRNKELAKQLKSFTHWGDFTLQKRQSLFGNIPLIGSRYRLGEVSVNGADNSLNKYARPLSLKKESVTYGASARHISDMSNVDENYFVMNGGQDSWLMNENIDDQIELWRKGEYIRIPLSSDAVRKHFNLKHLKLEASNNPDS